MVALRTRAVCADLWLAGFGPDASANWEVPFWSLERSFGLIGGELRGISATRRSCLFCCSRLTSAAFVSSRGLRTGYATGADPGSTPQIQTAPRVGDLAIGTRPSSPPLGQRP